MEYSVVPLFFSMMNLKNISDKKRDLIFQALETWDQSKDSSEFTKKILERGWSEVETFCYGSYKKCVWKDSIIAKFLKNEASDEAVSEINREYEQYFAVPYRLKKYFTRSYVFHNGLLIQDKVLKVCTPNCNLDEIRKEFNGQLYDYLRNHGHSNKGVVKFFDWVYRRSKPWFYERDRPLSDKPRENEFVGW